MHGEVGREDDPPDCRTEGRVGRRVGYGLSRPNRSQGDARSRGLRRSYPWYPKLTTELADNDDRDTQSSQLQHRSFRNAQHD